MRCRHRGDPWERRVDDFARNARVVLCVFSREYLESKFCENELRLNSNVLVVVPPCAMKDKDKISQLPEVRGATRVCVRVYVCACVRVCVCVCAAAAVLAVAVSFALCLCLFGE